MLQFKGKDCLMEFSNILAQEPFHRGGGRRVARLLFCTGRAGPEEKVLEVPGTCGSSVPVAAVGGEGAISVPGRVRSCHRFALLAAGRAVCPQPVSGSSLRGSGRQGRKPGPGRRTPIAQPGGCSPPPQSRSGVRAGVRAARSRPAPLLAPLPHVLTPAAPCCPPPCVSPLSSPGSPQLWLLLSSAEGPA